MKSNLEDLVQITENKSNVYKVEELVGVCKRIKNSKRDFLFVNKYQGKHFPQKPSNILMLLDEFVENIKINDEKILVIGFAETATAIGNYVSAKIPKCIYEMQTTRENIEGVEPIIEFREEHSHATEQLLYGNKDIFNLVERVLFVEDEITTGKTIINFINEIKKINSNLKYAVASILNWQTEEHSKIYKEYGIETFYLIKGKIKDINSKIEVNTLEEVNISDNTNNCIKNYEIKSELCNLEKNRTGRVPIKDIDFYSDYIFEKIKSNSKMLKEICASSNQNILVIGTEEFMYEPLLFANYLEKNTNNNVFYHATTRSPIEVSEDEGYILNRRYRFSSCYEENRTTYLYNIKKYDKVLIITDSKATEKFVKCMSDIFSNLAYDLNNIEIIKLGGYNGISS